MGARAGARAGARVRARVRAEAGAGAEVGVGAEAVHHPLRAHALRALKGGRGTTANILLTTAGRGGRRERSSTNGSGGARPSMCSGWPVDEWLVPNRGGNGNWLSRERRQRSCSATHGLGKRESGWQNIGRHINTMRGNTHRRRGCKAQPGDER